DLEDASPVGQDDADLRAQRCAAGARAAQPDFEEVDMASLGEVADEHLGRPVELVGHDVEITVTVQIEQDGGARAERAHHGEAAGGVRATPESGSARLGAGPTHRSPVVASRTIEAAPDVRRCTLRTGLDPEHEFAGDEVAAGLV